MVSVNSFIDSEAETCQVLKEAIDTISISNEPKGLLQQSQLSSVLELHTVEN